MTISMIGQHKIAGNYFQKAKAVQDIVKLETTYVDPSFYENCHPYFWIGDTHDTNISECKIFSESIFLDLN